MSIIDGILLARRIVALGSENAGLLKSLVTTVENILDPQGRRRALDAALAAADEAALMVSFPATGSGKKPP